ncbi:MAG TPA: DUF6345 domain-containing protein [Candidatus Solibacter sp.]|nr:DUF6345 domain-containing protein [Candidatus Solibacter sp.]
MKRTVPVVTAQGLMEKSANRFGVTSAIGFGTALVFWLASFAVGQEPSHLPVYKVVKEGATASEGGALVRQLGITAKRVVPENGGTVEFVDAARYLTLPTETATETVTKSEHLHRAIEATQNKDATRRITPTLLNVRSVERLHVVEEKYALSNAAEAFERAGLTPQFGKAFVGHHELSLYSKDGEKKLMRDSAALDTEVMYRFTDPNGYPIFGPGAQAQISYDATEHVSRVYYAARKLEADGTVEIIPQGEAEEQIARLLPPKSKIQSRLIYYAPSIADGSETSRVAALIPWYAYYGTRQVTNPQTGAATEVKTKIGFIPATRDRRFVPTVKLEASGRSEVHASVSVEGGRPPYRFIWGGANPAIGEGHDSSVRYTPRFRAERSLLTNPNFRVEREERISVTVIDANGVAVSAIHTLPVEASPFFPEGEPGRNQKNPTYGSENPGTPTHWVPAQVAWNKEMGTPGGGATLSFNWGGDSAWPGDFIRPTPAGKLVATPWVYGDADFANWGVDTADIVLDNADGWPDGTVLMYPGAAGTDYNTSNGGSISSPVSSPDVQIGSQSYTVGYNGSWGPVGSNDTLEWLLLDDCDMLDALDGAKLNVAQRWGPAFGGLHVLTGFASEGYGDGAFEGGVADRVLGVNGQTAQTIVQSWFNSASATSAGTAAAMGPAIEIMPGLFICDYGDYFWGKGPVGPTIVPSSYPASMLAYWYVTSTTALQYLF